MLVNSARSASIEPHALLESLKAGRPGFAAIDVFGSEPIFDGSHLFLQMPNVICTPHLGYVEKEGYDLYFGIAFQNVLDWMKAGFH